mgnify:CR=1 FL=1
MANERRSGFNNDAYIELIGNLATVKDPETGNQVHAYSKQMPNSNSKVANAMLAVNHPNEDEADFWKLEVWSHDPNRSGYHNFLMDHCEKGRLVMVRGVPVLKKDKNDKSRIYPTIIVDKIVGLSSPNSGNNNNNQQSQSQQAQLQNNPQTSYYIPQQPNGFQPAPQQQAGFPQQQPFAGQQPGAFPQPPQGGFAPQPNQAQSFGAPQGFGYGAPQGQFPPNGAPNSAPFGAR